MSDIKNELQKDKQGVLNKFESLANVSQLKLLQSSEDGLNSRIALGLGKNHSIIRALNAKGEVERIKNLDEQYEGNIYSIEQIKNLCKRYDLTFGRSKHYYGDLNNEVIEKIKEFVAINGNIGLDHASLELRYMILADSRLFKSKSNHEHNNNAAIFYEIDSNTYRLIHNWNSGFSFSQRVRGILRSDSSREGVIWGLVVALVIWILLCFFNAPVFSGWYLFGIFLPIIGGACSNVDDEESKMYHEGKWLIKY